MLSLYLLGIPRIELDGTVISVDTRKAIALVAYVAVQGEAQPRDSLAALLWPDLDQKRARGALRRTLSALKSQIGDTYLATSRESIGLDPQAEIWIDVNVFRNLLSGAEHSASTTEQQLAKLAQAIELYRETFMVGFTLRDAFPFDDWQFIEAEALRREASHALAQIVHLQTNAGLLTEAISTAQRWLSMDPLQEEVHRHLMRLYTWTGERSMALRQYQSCVQALDDELGVPPLEETDELFQAIQENRLEPRPASTAATQRAAAQQSASAVQQPQIEVGPSRSAEEAPPLVGRDNQMAQLWKTYQGIAEDGSVVTLEGETGIGKSRLAREFMQQAAQQAVAVSVRCYEGESNLAYAPIVQCIREAMKQHDLTTSLQRIPDHHLAEVARLMPEIAQMCPNLPVASSSEGPGAQGRFFEAVCQLLATLCISTKPGVLFFDDFHWADTTSLELVAFLMRRLNGKPLLILLAWRDEELIEGHRLRQIVAETQRAGFATHMALPRLAKAEIAEYLQIVRPDHTEKFVDRLWQETEGLPYFLIEYINASEALPPDAKNDDKWHIPVTVRDFLLSQITSLDEAARQLLQTAAVIGRAFDAELLQAGSGRSDEEFVIGLEGLLAHQLVRERVQNVPDSGDDSGIGSGIATASYDFYHDKLRILVYEEMSLVRRRLLHQRMAATLIQLAQRRSHVERMAGSIAHHLRLAGQGVDAAAYYRRAATYARSLFANKEALSHYQMALELGDPDRATLYVAIGDLYKLRGHYDDALHAYGEARTLYQAPQGDSHNFASVAYKLGHVFYRRGELKPAEEHFERASIIWSAQESVDDLAALYAEWSHVAHLRQEPARAIELAKQSLALAEKSADKPAAGSSSGEIPLARAYNILGILSRHQGALAEAIAYLQKSLQSTEPNRHPHIHMAALNNLGLVQLEAKNIEEAYASFERALVLCRRVGDRHREAAIYNNLADAFHRAGDEGAAMARLKEAVTIFAELGTSADEWQPEIWQLTEW